MWTYMHTHSILLVNSNMHKDKKQAFNTDSEVADYKLLYMTVNSERLKMFKMKAHKMVSRERQCKKERRFPLKWEHKHDFHGHHY